MVEKIYPNAYIYLITVMEKQSKFFGEQYVGKCNGNRKDYITGGTIINRIIKKYGTGSFNKEIIIKQPMTNSQMNELEKFYIDYYDTFNNGLNLTFGGDGINGIKAQNHPRYDHTIYTFYHKDGMEFIGTQYEFKIKYDPNKRNVSTLLQGRQKSVKGWYYNKELINKPKNFNKELICKPKDLSIYTFCHKDGTEFIGTQYDFRIKYKLDRGSLSKLLKCKVKSVKGWKYIKKA